MRDVAALQDAFQKAILDGDDAVLAQLLDGPRERRETLFGVYRHAYAARLVEILGADFPALKATLGDGGFDEAARAYVAARPSTHRNARWVGRDLADFLSATPPFDARPLLGELAGFEAALADAFDAADAAVLELAQLADIPPDDWARLALSPHPSARRLDLTTNAVDVWSAVSEGSAPLEEAAPGPPAKLIVWRADATPMYREMPDEEAMLWDEAARGATFGQLCVLAATRDDPDGAAGRAAGHLVGWINAGLLAATDRGR